MKFLGGLSLVTSALAVKFPGVHMPRTTALTVTVESVGNSALKAVITNTGSESLKLMKAGSILDDRAVERAEIYSGSESATLEHLLMCCISSRLWNYLLTPFKPIKSRSKASD